MMNIVIYGLGTWVDNHLTWLKENYNLIGGYDRDTSKAAKADILTIPFLSIAQLKAQTYDAIMITSTFTDEISNYLENELQIHTKILNGNEEYKLWEKSFFSVERSFGEDNPQKKFSVIAQAGTSAQTGIFVSLVQFLMRMNRDVRKKYIPVIDMQNHLTIYHKSIEEVGKINAWELFFFQSYSLDDIKTSKHVKFETSNLPLHEIVAEKERIIHDPIYRKKLSSLCRLYIQPNLRLMQEYENARGIFDIYRNQGKKITGLCLRGTDYVKGKPYMHHIQPTFEMVKEKIQQSIDDWGTEVLYINSDEEKMIHDLHEAFSDIPVISMKRQRYDSYSVQDNTTVVEVKFDQEDDEYRRGADYIISTMLFRECDFFIAGICGSSLATLILKNDFEKEYLFSDLGYYGIDDDAYICTPDGHPIYA